MYKLYSCLVEEHDAMLIALSALICAGSVVSSFKCYALVGQAASQRAGWLLLAAASMASGIWATHFVAMLAYNPPVPVGYSVGLTVLSFVIAAVATSIGFEVCWRNRTSDAGPLLGGGIVGAGIGGMHFTGMGALQLPGKLAWDHVAIAVSVLIGIGLAAAAMWTLHKRPGKKGFWQASALLVTAICGLHFTAMSAVTVIPDPALEWVHANLDRALLAFSVSMLTLIVFAAGLASITIERLRDHVASQVRQLQIEIDERRRAESVLQQNEARMFSHQATIAELMRDDCVRGGSLEEANRRLMRTLARVLEADRVGFLLLDRSKLALSWKEVYVAGDDQYIVPEGYGSVSHLAALMKSSASEVVTVEDTSVANILEDLKEPFFEKQGIQSVLHAPIIAHGELVGFITCTNIARKVSWTAEQRVIALSIANLAAVVVERHQRLELESKAQRSAERLGRQQVLLRELTGSENLRSGEVDQLFAEVATSVCRDMDVDRVSVRFFTDDSQEEVHTAVRLADEERLVPVPRRGSRRYPEALAKAIADGPVIVNDCASDPLTNTQYENELRSRRIRAMLHAPIRNEDAVIGVVACSVYDVPREWSPEDVALLCSVSSILALANERRLRLKMEENLRQANLFAQEASRAKTLFLANMSHEIRTPMNGVLGMADLLSRTELTDRQKRLAGTITESARSLLTIINDILDISRIEGGKLELDQNDFDLSRCIEDAAELLAEQAHKKSLDLTLFIEQAANGIVRGDAVRLRQVLINLIGNAIKFTEQGEVSVHVATLVRDGRQHVRFEVRDTGIGIDPQVQAKLFQPFAQADTSITRRFGGTGLGLSISRHLIEMMGGQIEIESEPGEGTRIWFALPMEVSAGNGAIRALPATLAGRKVLVVDDRATNREIVCSYLATSGAVIDSADGADAAIELLVAAAAAGQPFELAIVDYIMAGCNGVELARRIKELDDLAGLRVILLSSMSWSGGAGELAEAGIGKVLNKPLRRAELVAAASEALSQTHGAGLAHVQSTIEPGAKCLGLKVLVAEDNPVNQVVAEEFLTNLGCSVTIVETGAQAIAALARGAFDIVLMDCHMPEMDGYTATQMQRERESAGGLVRTPIVAVTANAYEADRQACLEAGMDGYLSKPYSERDLAAAMTQYVSRGTLSGATTSATSTMDRALAAPVKIPGARPQVPDRLMRTYVEHAMAALPALRKATADKDAAALLLIAHSLRSSSANVGEKATSACCLAIEEAGRSGDIELCCTLAGELADAVRQTAEQFKGMQALTAAAV